MKFNQGASVFASDEKEVGRLDRVVVDPRSQEVTHLVVSRGLLFGNDKVVPLDMVASASKEQVVLKEDKQRVESLPNFNQDRFVSLNEMEAGRQRRSWGTARRLSILILQLECPRTGTGLFRSNHPTLMSNATYPQARSPSKKGRVYGLRTGSAWERSSRCLLTKAA